MAEALREGGLYKVGDKFVDANGKEVDAPSKTEQESGTDAGGALAEDFPARDTLVAAGFDTPEKVKAASDDDLLALDGVGPATLEKIRKA